MTGIKRLIIGTIAVGIGVLPGLAGPAAASGQYSAPQVEIKDTGKVWAFASAQVQVAVRCFGGAVVQGLVVDVVQGDASAHADGDFGIVCDGVRRLIPVVAQTDGAEFDGGRARVTARLTVLEPGTTHPLPPGVDNASVYLRPVAAVRVANGPVRLNANGNAVVRALMKCQQPWVSQSFGVDVTQNRGRIIGTAYVNEPPCDGTFHEYTFTIRPNQPFTPGGVKVSASVSVLDPWAFDPLGAAGVQTNRQAIPWGQ